MRCAWIFQRDSGRTPRRLARYKFLELEISFISAAETVLCQPAAEELYLRKFQIYYAYIFVKDFGN